MSWLGDVFDDVGNALQDVGDFVGNTVQDIWDSDLGKLALIGGGLYLGGAFDPTLLEGAAETGGGEALTGDALASNTLGGDALTSFDSFGNPVAAGSDAAMYADPYEIGTNNGYWDPTYNGGEGAYRLDINGVGDTGLEAGDVGAGLGGEEAVSGLDLGGAGASPGPVGGWGEGAAAAGAGAAAGAAGGAGTSIAQKILGNGANIAKNLLGGATAAKGAGAGTGAGGSGSSATQKAAEPSAHSTVSEAFTPEQMINLPISTIASLIGPKRG